MRRNTAGRAWITLALIDALFLHGLLMVLAAVPLPAGGRDAFAVLHALCSPAPLTADGPASPEDASRKPLQCNLCGTGHCGLGLPAGGSVLAFSSEPAAAFTVPTAREHAPVHTFRTAHRPRAPPVPA